MKELTIHIKVTPGLFRCAMVAVLLSASASELASESLTLTTYYPAPSGVYSQMITTGDTWLARDGGKLDVGGTIRTANGQLVSNNASGLFLNAGPNGDVYFRKNTTLGEENSYTNLARITADGKMAIGTHAPLTTLDISGGDAIRLPNRAADPEISANARGALYYNTNSQSLRVNSNSGWRDVGDGGMYISNLYNSPDFQNVNYCESRTFTVRAARNLTRIIPMLTGWRVGDFDESVSGAAAASAGVQIVFDSYNSTSGDVTLRLHRLSRNCSGNWDSMRVNFYLVGY